MPAIEQIAITAAESAEDLSRARELFKEYAAWLGFSLDFQDFEEELATLPGKYAPPSGRLLLARCDNALAGSAALRQLAPEICEMKRLYVRPQFRGCGLGRKLAERLIREARSIGYGYMRLDTVPSRMAEANLLYRALGFYEIPAYCYNPQPDTIYFEYRLK